MIIRLSNKGDCYASNKYFAKELQIHHVNVSKYVAGLQEKGYIETENIYRANTKQIEKRIIKISQTYKQKHLYPLSENANTPISENAKENIQDINKQFNIITRTRAKKNSFMNYSNTTTEEEIKQLEKLYKKYGGVNE